MRYQKKSASYCTYQKLIKGHEIEEWVVSDLDTNRRDDNLLKHGNNLCHSSSDEEGGSMNCAAATTPI